MLPNMSGCDRMFQPHHGGEYSNPRAFSALIFRARFMLIEPDLCNNRSSKNRSFPDSFTQYFTPRCSCFVLPVRVSSRKFSTQGKAENHHHSTARVSSRKVSRGKLSRPELSVVTIRDTLLTSARIRDSRAHAFFVLFDRQIRLDHGILQK